MHRFSSRSDESDDLTRRATEAPANVLYGTLRRPTERNTVRADDFVAAVENLCIVGAYPRCWVILILLVLPLMLSAHGQQPEEVQELNDFLPNDEGKALISQYCLRCHSASRIRQSIAQRAGGDEPFWSTLVEQMVRVWNAPIAEEEVTSIVTYLSRHFGPSSRSSTTQDHSVLQADPEEELSKFLPDDEGKVLLTVYCRGCHSATQIRRNLALRAGGNGNYWNALVQRMMTVWNAPIAEEDVAPIVTYLSKHFGPSWDK